MSLKCLFWWVKGVDFKRIIQLWQAPHQLSQQLANSSHMCEVFSLNISLIFSFHLCPPSNSVFFVWLFLFPCLSVFSLSELENIYSAARRNKSWCDCWFSAWWALIGNQAVVIRMQILPSTVNLSQTISSTLALTDTRTQSHREGKISKCAVVVRLRQENVCCIDEQ